MGAASALFLAVFLACAVEAVEATTIVLAAAPPGTGARPGSASAPGSRCWPSSSPRSARRCRRSRCAGCGWSSARCCWSSACSGCARRSCGRAATRRCTTRTDLTPSTWPRRGRAGAARGCAGLVRLHPLFKGVVLEGLEVVFIVLTFGSNPHDIGLAAVAAAARSCSWSAPVSPSGRRWRRVPENTMKFVVGIMLTSFGVFWGAEGAGAHWPGSDAALLVLIPAVALFGWAWSRCCAAAAAPPASRPPPPASRHAASASRWSHDAAARLRRVLVRLRDRRRLAGRGRRGGGARR